MMHNESGKVLLMVIWMLMVLATKHFMALSAFAIMDGKRNEKTSYCESMRWKGTRSEILPPLSS